MFTCECLQKGEPRIETQRNETFCPTVISCCDPSTQIPEHRECPGERWYMVVGSMDLYIRVMGNMPRGHCWRLGYGEGGKDLSSTWIWVSLGKSFGS